MTRTHVITNRVVTPAQFDPETGVLVSPEEVTFETTTVPFTPEEEAAADAPPSTVALALYAADQRRALINGSTTIDVGERSIPVWVDPESRGSVTGLVVATGIVPNLTAPWKGADGVFYTLTAAEITALALGMMTYVQTCFAAESSIAAAIESNAITTFAGIDAAFAAALA